VKDLSETSERIRRAAIAVCEALIAHQPAATRWEELTENNLWFELASCILGSCVPYEHASSVVRRLQFAGLLNIDRARRDLEAFETRVANVLSRPARVLGCGKNAKRYRFPFLRARHIRRTVELIYGRGTTLREILRCAGDTKKARTYVVLSAVGAGPKQASLFLRNIGYAADLAILDTHILRYMRWMGLTEATEHFVHTIRAYEALEDTFRDHVHALGFAVADYDVAVWVTMRAFRSEARA
jgi:N-glycosylase/DNA lyase